MSLNWILNFNVTSFSDGSCGVMGYGSEESKARGSLFLVTRDTAPYCGKFILLLLLLLTPSRYWDKRGINTLNNTSYIFTFLVRYFGLKGRFCIFPLTQFWSMAFKLLFTKYSHLTQLNQVRFKDFFSELFLFLVFPRSSNEGTDSTFRENHEHAWSSSVEHYRTWWRWCYKFQLL